MATITQYTPEEIMSILSQKTGMEIKQADLAKMLNVSRQYIVQMKNKLLPVKYTSILENKLKNNEDNDYIVLDYYPEVCGSCGNGAFEFSVRKELISVPKSSFFQRLSNVKNYFVINAIGNSMEPLIYDGDKLIIEQYEGEQILDNRPYLFCRNDEIFIKRLAKNVDQLMIISENKMFDVRKLEGEQLNEVNIIGQVVGLMRDMR